MKKFAYSFAGLVLAASAASAQDIPNAADDIPPPEAAEPADPAVPADPATDSAAIPAEPATPADAATTDVTAAPEVTEAEIESFAQATVALQEIQADTTVSDKQGAMAEAVTEAGLDPEKYNAIARAAQADAELRTKVQTAMAKYAGPDQG
jgi:hypothetical protein